MLYTIFYLISCIPAMFFAGYSIVNPVYNNYQTISSLIISIFVLIIYSFIFFYLCIYLKGHFNDKNSILVFFFTFSLKTKEVTINTTPIKLKLESKQLPQIIVEHHSFDEDLCNPTDVRTSARNLDRTDLQIRSEPVSMLKYKSPEGKIETSATVPIRLLIQLYEFGILALISFILGCSQHNPITACTITLVLLFGFLGFLSYTSPFVHPVYQFIHIFLFANLLFITVFLYTSNIDIVYYVGVIFTAGILFVFGYQVSVIFINWVNKEPEAEVRQFTLSNHEPSASYVRDSVPEERAPGSATINHFSCEISQNGEENQNSP